MKVHVFPVRFRSTTPSPVPARHKKLYQNIATVLFADEMRSEGPEIHCPETLPLPSEHAHLQHVSTVLVEAMTRHVYENLLVDLGGPDEKDIASPHVLAGVMAVTNLLLRKNPNLRIGLFLPVALSDEDLMAATLRDAADRDRVRLLFGNGTAWGKYFEKHAAPPTVVRWSEDARSDPLDALEKKLIRRVGQYTLGGSEQIIRYYYDGQKACDEIYDIVLLELQQSADLKKTRKIYYDVRHSAWFREPVEAALGDRDLLRISERITEETSHQELAESDLLLLPIVRTGRSLQMLLGRLDDSNRLPRAWSLLSTAGPKRRHGDRQVTIIDPHSVEHQHKVRYELRVAGEDQPDLQSWRRMSVTPVVPSNEDLSAPLSAEAMWGMILEAGLTQESPVPKGRPSLGYVPDFSTIARLNAGFIAAKVQALLEARFKHSLAHSLAFLCPSEPNAKTVAESLRHLANHDTIFVAREVIDACLDTSDLSSISPATMHSERCEFDFVSAKLRMLRDLTRGLPDPEKPQIVLIDEFDKSGATFRGMFNLATAFELNVLCAISLARFGSYRRNEPLTHLTLYELDYSHFVPN